MQQEKWKDVIGWEGLYQVSDLGKIRSLDREVLLSNGKSRKVKGKIMSQGLSSGRYPSVVLSKGGNATTCYVHRLVVEAFIKELSAGDTVDHINRDTMDNRLENLRVATRIEQAANKSTKSSSTLEFIGIELIHTSGTIMSYDETFCTRNGLKKGDVLRVIRGERDSCGGWRLK